MNKKQLKKEIKLYCHLANISYRLRFGRVCLSMANYSKVCNAFITTYGLLYLVKIDFQALILPTI